MTDRRPMGRPPKARMLYYDDARHAYLYTVEPPPEELDVLHPVDVISNSMVDTFVFGLGIGRTMSYGTQVGEIWFDGAEDHVAAATCRFLRAHGCRHDAGRDWLPDGQTRA